MTRALLSRLCSRLQTPAQQIFARNSSTVRNWVPTSSKGTRQKQGSPGKRPTIRDLEQAPSDEVVPGSHTTRVAERYNIGLPNQLRRLPVKLKSNDGSVQFFFSKRHLFDRNDMKWLDKLEHPFAGSVLERYSEWSAGGRPLWLSVNTYGSVAPFVCTTAQRRLNRGLRLALEEKGYDRFGNRLASSDPKQPPGSAYGLFGTLRIIGANPKSVCQQTSSSILLMGRAVVAAAEVELTTRPNTSPLVTTPQNRPQNAGAGYSGDIVFRKQRQVSGHTGSESSFGYKPRSTNTQHVRRPAKQRESW